MTDDGHRFYQGKPGPLPPPLPDEPWKGRTLERGRPILDIGQLGPWKGRVRVVPLLDGRDVAFFEVVADWTGPGLGELPQTSRVDVAVQDVARVDQEELARAVAAAAGELLRGAATPWLRHLKQALEHAGPGWRRAYDQLVLEGLKTDANKPVEWRQ